MLLVDTSMVVMELQVVPLQTTHLFEAGPIANLQHAPLRMLERWCAGRATYPLPGRRAVQAGTQINDHDAWMQVLYMGHRA